MPKKPTERQKLAVKKLAENVRTNKPQPIGEILREVGYSESIAASPQHVTDSKGFRALLEAALPDELLLEVHLDGLSANRFEHKVVGYDKKGNPKYEMVEVRDFNARHKYLDSAYKLKGAYKETAPPPTFNQINIFNNPQVAQIVKEYEDKMKAVMMTPPEEAKVENK